MTQVIGRLARHARVMRERSGAELEAMFGAWVALPQDFGGGRRRRLFFPLAGVLAVPLAVAFGRSVLSWDFAQVPGVDGLAGAQRLGPDGRLLQGALAAPADATR